jgi:hypothetical protein
VLVWVVLVLVALVLVLVELVLVANDDVVAVEVSVVEELLVVVANEVVKLKVDDSVDVVRSWQIPRQALYACTTLLSYGEAGPES